MVYIISNLSQEAYLAASTFLTYKEGDEFLAVDVTIDGPDGQKTMPIYLDPEDRESVIGPGYSFVVTECGTYTINAEAWPRDIDDAYPEDNYDSVTITVGREAPIIKEKLEPGIHGEQGGGGAR